MSSTWSSTDGFTGNIALKLIEGVSVADAPAAARRRETGRCAPRSAGCLLRPSIQGLREEIDPELTGGAYMLGLRQIGIVCHGRFTRRGFARAIEVAAHGVEEDVIGRTRAALAEAGALRKPAPDGSNGEAEGDLGEAAAKPAEAISPSERGGYGRSANDS